MKAHMKPKSSSVRGVVLMEALIGILIFSIGVLGLVGLQASMARAQTGTKIRAEAVLLANEVVGLMWADRQQNFSKYNPSSCAGHAPCKAWQEKVKRSLPGGVGAVQYDAANLSQVQVTVSWTLPDEGAHKYEMTGVVAP